jgi:preprotein translocase subunit YajC
MISTFVLALADGAAAPQGGGDGGAVGGCAGGGGMSSLLFMLLMFAVFWFILIRPQQKRAKEHNAFLSALKKGDQVVTRGGIVGRVSGVADNVVTLEIQEKVRVRVLKSYIESRHNDASSSAAAADKTEKKSEPAPAQPESKN